MLNYGIFGMTQTNSMYGRMLRSRGCPVIALGGSLAETDQCEKNSFHKQFLPQAFTSSPGSYASTPNAGKYNSLHRSCFHSTSTNYTEHRSLWSMVQEEKVSGIILGGRHSLKELFQCFQSRNEWTLKNADSSLSPAYKFIALETSCLVYEDIHILENLISIYKQDISLVKDGHPSKYIIITHPLFFMRHDPVLRYTSAILEQAAGKLDYISLTHMSSSQSAFSAERPKALANDAQGNLAGGECLHAVDQLRSYLKGDLPLSGKEIQLCQNSVSRTRSVQFYTPSGIAGNVMVIPDYSLENLTITVSGINGVVVSGEITQVSDQILVETWPTNSETAQEAFSKSFFLPVPKLAPVVQSPMEVRWSEAVWGFLKSMRPRNQETYQALNQSLEALIKLKDCMNLAKQLFLLG